MVVTASFSGQPVLCANIQRKEKNGPIRDPRDATFWKRVGSHTTLILFAFSVLRINSTRRSPQGFRGRKGEKVWEVPILTHTPSSLVSSIEFRSKQEVQQICSFIKTARAFLHFQKQRCSTDWTHQKDSAESLGNSHRRRHMMLASQTMAASFCSHRKQAAGSSSA